MQAEKGGGNRAAAAFAPRFCLWRTYSLPQMHGGGDFGRLDERCVAHILSFTSPRDVCRLSAVSRKFKAAAESEVPWQRFLPSDWWQLIPRSVSALHFASKRDLFFRFSESILIDDSRRCLWLEKSSGKKCWMVSPRELDIVRRDDTECLQWITDPAETRSSVFPEVAELIDVWWFVIQGTIDMADLSSNTRYAVRFLVGYRPNHSRWAGLPQIVLSLHMEEGPPMQAQKVSLHPEQRGSAQQRSKEHQGWICVHVGEFFSSVDGGKVKFSMHQTKTEEGKTGILVAGVEISPCSSDLESK